VRAIALMTTTTMMAGLTVHNKAAPQRALINTAVPYAAFSLSAPATAHDNYLFSIAVPPPRSVLPNSAAIFPPRGCRR